MLGDTLCGCRGWCRKKPSVTLGLLPHSILFLPCCYGLWGGCPGVPDASGTLAKASHQSPCHHLAIPREQG